VLEVGDTEIEAEVAPVLQLKEYGEVPPVPLAVRLALAPLQMATVAGEMLAVGLGLTVTFLVALAVQPLLSVTVTV